MSIHMAKPEHEIAYQELTEILRKHAGHLSGVEMLAIAANMVGKIIAMQDQRKVSPAMAMEIVARNIEVGNKHIIGNIKTESEGSA